MIRERDMVEMMVPALLLRVLVRDIRNHHDTPAGDAAELDGIDADIEAALNEVRARDRAKARKAEDRAAKAINGALGQRYASLPAIILAIRLTIERLIAEGWFEVGAESAFARAWDRFAEGIQQAPDADGLDRPERRGEADRLHREIRGALAERNLFVAREGQAA